MVRQICFFLFFKYVLLIMLLQLSHFFSPLSPPLPCTILPTSTPLPYFMSMGHTYKFFGFSIFCTILTLPLPIFSLHFKNKSPLISISPLIFFKVMRILEEKFQGKSEFCVKYVFFMPMGHAYKFFGFSMSHSIVNLPLSVL